MKTRTFKGGVHPCCNKEKTRSIPIETLEPAEIMAFPMVQNAGAPCEPTVQKGDYVKMWQKIGDSGEYVSSPVHSSVSGEVVAVEMRPAPAGGMVKSVVIKNDFKDELYEGIAPANPDSSLVDVIREAGIVGMGGAGFPTHVKLNPPKDKKIDMVIVNGAECEPYLTSDHRVMLETPDEVLEGLSIILRGLSVPRGIIAIENNKQDAIELLSKKAERYENIQVANLKTKYPQGSEKHLIWAVSGRRIASGKLPMDVGVIVVNIDTCTAIARAFSRGMPLVRRIITVGGPIVKSPKNFAVRLGTPVSELIKAAGGTTEEVRKLIMGGPMMGIALSTLDIPVVKGMSALLAFGEADADTGREMPCIRCGKCVRVCPMGLNPSFLSTRSAIGDWEACEKLSIFDCIECGCCSYVCPSNRYIVQGIRLAKAKIRERR